ncbi:MAG: metallophosphoesterase [Bacteroidales bacterium]
MKSSMFLFRVLIFVFLFWACTSDNKNPKNQINSEFTFAFLTDIHVEPERRAMEGFQMAIDTINSLAPDFVITGGDLIMDALAQDHSRADSLYLIYNSLVKKFKMPVHNTIGNHELFGIYQKSGVDPEHPEYGKKMFENRIGKRYYSFDHKGWHFMILDGIGITPERTYVGLIDSVQMNWIKNDLLHVDDTTPIAISIHIPMLTVATQLERGALEPNGPAGVVANSREVLAMFASHKLKLVMQGHLHFIEDIYVNGTHFITGGAVCAGWWKGSLNGMEEGFMLFRVKDDNISWEYVDYGWEAE